MWRPKIFDGFVASLIATFGGTNDQAGRFSPVTPTPSSTMSQLVLTPVRHHISLWFQKRRFRIHSGWKRTGYLVTDMGDAIRAAKANGRRTS